MNVEKESVTVIVFLHRLFLFEPCYDPTRREGVARAENKNQIFGDFLVADKKVPRPSVQQTDLCQKASSRKTKKPKKSPNNVDGPSLFRQTLVDSTRSAHRGL